MNASNKVEVVAEIACGHTGIDKRLFELTSAAIDSGVSSIKYQIYNLHERAEQGTKEYDIFQKHLLNISAYEKAVSLARRKEIRVYADIYGFNSLQTANNLELSGVKIHAEDFNNLPLIVEAITSFNTIIISVGGSTYKSIIELRDLIQPLLIKDSNKLIYIVDGIQLFPTPREGHSLANLLEVIKIFTGNPQIKVGVADHISPEDPYSFIYPCTAIGLGARYIEKHLTINREDKWTDWHSAFTPEDLSILNESILSIQQSLFTFDDFQDMGREYKNMFQKYPVITSRRSKKILENDISYKKVRNESQSYITHSYITENLSRLIKADGNNIVRYSDFSPTVGAIVTVRMSSSRLPGKALMNINGIPSILVVLDRVKRIKGLDKIIVATSTESSDDELVAFLLGHNFQIYRGDLTSIPTRLLGAAMKFKLDHIVRITGDCVCLDYESMSMLVKHHLDISPDCSLLSNSIFGTNKEIISFQALQFLTNRISSNKSSEYLEYFLTKPCLLNTSEVNVNYCCQDSILNSRLTLDYIEDLEAISSLYSHLKDGHLSTMRDIVDLLSSPVFKMTNQYMQQKNPLNLDLSLDISYD